ncbi:MAG TPA: amidohydrolase family protein [Candidatus Hydrogenedentes bacterium]|nr:amidohydrolase family protein [Candidatus Hydrogenedentota bacterium]HPG65272.1 amidohydrolase family protein [Candidatus Hydrogenedentota bacterium]
MRIFNAHVVTPERILPHGGVECLNGRVMHVFERCDSGDVDLESCYLLPGLIDLHTHPPMADGLDQARLAGLCHRLRGLGTAGFLFATGNIAVGEQVETLEALRTNLDALGAGQGCLGIHLEGPYVAPEMRGGFLPEAITTPEDFPVEQLLDAAGPWAKYINISPELPGAIDAIRACRRRGLAVSIGHSGADRDALFAAQEAGAQTICHLFNTGAIMRFKEPGVLDVTLDLLGLASRSIVCEIICDGIHVDPMLVGLVYRAKGPDGIALITDSLMGGASANEGQVVESPMTQYTVVDGAARNPEGGLCGSTLTMAGAVARFAQFAPCSLVEAARAGAMTPARLLGMDRDFGSIAAGRRALFCVLDQALEPRQHLARRLNEYDESE